MIDLSKFDPNTTDQRTASQVIVSAVTQWANENPTQQDKAWNTIKAWYPALFAKAFPDVADIRMPAPTEVGRFTSGHEAFPGLPTPANPNTSKSTLLDDNLRAATRVLTGQRPGLNLQRGKMALPNSESFSDHGLPTDCSFDEWKTAVQANQGEVPRNSVRIFQALKSTVAGATDADRESAARKRFPQLAEENETALAASAKADDDARKARLASGTSAALANQR